MLTLKKVLQVVLVLLFLTLGCIGQPEEESLGPEEVTEKELLILGEEAYYAHTMLGNPAGYTHFIVTEPVTYQEEDVLVVEAETLLNLEMAGTPMKMQYESTEYYTQQLMPKYYKAAISVADIQTDIECSFEEGTVVESVQSAGSSDEKEIPVSTDIYLLDSNMFHHYVFLFRTLDPQPGTTADVTLFMPQAMQSFDVTIEFIEEDSALGVSCIYAEATLFQQGHKFWVTQQGELLALEIPSQSFRMELSDSSVTEREVSVEIIELFSAPSNVTFDDPFSVDYLKVKVTADIVAEPVDEDFLSSDYQTFSGTTTETKIDGIFEVRTEKFSGPGEVYPVSEPQQYLAPEPNIESDDPAIKARAEQVAEGSTDSWEASQKIARWVYVNITYKVTGAGAKETLETRQGDCGPHSYLTVAMLRSIGIPSRIVGGMTYGRVGGEPFFIQHYWTEVLINEKWIPIDSTAGQYGYIDATHVRFFRLGGIQNLTVEVIEHTQAKPEIKVEQKEALLKPGEYGKYRFVIDDVEFGYSDYKIVKKETYNGQEAYYVELSLDLDYTKIGTPITATMDAVLYITEDIRPLFYQVDAQVDSDHQTIECTFSENKVTDVVFARGKTYEEEVTLEENTYVMHSNMIGLWAFVYRSLKLEVGETYTVPVFFSENFTKLTVDVEVLRTETITVAGKSYEVFVCDVPLFKEVDYVTKDGLLVKVDLPSQNGYIELMEYSSDFFLI